MRHGQNPGYLAGLFCVKKMSGVTENVAEYALPGGTVEKSGFRAAMDEFIPAPVIPLVSRVQCFDDHAGLVPGKENVIHPAP